MTSAPDDATRRDLGIAAYASQLGLSEEAVESYFLDTFGAAFSEEAFRATGGEAWHGPSLTRRERSLITVAILATLGGVEERLAGHVRWALAHGASVEELGSAMTLVANYAGFARASIAMELIGRVAAEEPGAEVDDL